MNRSTCCLLVALSMTACSRNQEPERTSPPPATTTESAPAVQASHDLVWDAPAAWEKAPNPNAMRKATYRIPKAAGDTESTELAVSQAGGAAAANIDRWVNQFAPGANVDKKERMVGALKVTVVEIKGSFSGGGMPGMGAGSGPKDHFMLLGAIANDGGADSTFFKMVGPEKSVSAAHDDFDKLVASLKKG